MFDGSNLGIVFLVRPHDLCLAFSLLKIECQSWNRSVSGIRKRIIGAEVLCDCLDYVPCVPFELIGIDVYRNRQKKVGLYLANEHLVSGLLNVPGKRLTLLF